MQERCVAHLDMDAFYVSVELRRRPELRGLPVVVAGSGPRAVVTTASYEARRFGIGSAMPAARARRLCPDAVYLVPDFAYYREVSRAVMAIVRSHIEIVEVVGLDEAYLELSGLPAPHAAMRRVSAEIERNAGLGCSVGIGPSKLVAKVASDAEKPRGFVVLTREQACVRFAPAPCGLIPGIGPKTAERLRAARIRTLAELASAPRRELAARFGSRLAGELQRRARFEDDAPVTEERKVLSESRETTFDHDVADSDKLEAVLDELVGRLCEALVGQGRGGRTIGIKVRLDDFSTHTRAKTLAGPVSKRPVRLLGVRVAGLEPLSGAHDEQLMLAV
jgi:DNA polymerase-4